MKEIIISGRSFARISELDEKKRQALIYSSCNGKSKLYRYFSSCTWVLGSKKYPYYHDSDEGDHFFGKELKSGTDYIAPEQFEFEDVFIEVPSKELKKAYILSFKLPITMEIDPEQIDFKSKLNEKSQKKISKLISQIASIKDEIRSYVYENKNDIKEVSLSDLFFINESNEVNTQLNAKDISSAASAENWAKVRNSIYEAALYSVNEHLKNDAIQEVQKNDKSLNAKKLAAYIDDHRVKWKELNNDDGTSKRGTSLDKISRTLSKSFKSIDE